jgi:hypothetical protein
MTRLTLGFIGVLVVASVSASLAIRHSGQVKLPDRAEALRQQTEQLARLSAENERLSNQVARVKGTPSLPPDELRELLRLRGQIGLLRQAGTEMAQLQAANEQLRATTAGSEQQLAQARAAPNFWAKEQLTFAGYANPEATLKATLWAMNNADIKTFLTCWTLSPALEDLRQKAEAEMAAEGKSLAENLAPSIGFHIIDKQVRSADEVVLNVSFDGEGKTRRFIVKKVGSEWKLAGLEEP